MQGKQSESGTNQKFLLSIKSKCRKCDLLYELWDHTPKSDRDYWIMTELFVMLHDGKDVCDESTQPYLL